MKIRNGFVTNSSSSSFVIAKKDNFSKEEEQIIIEYVKKNMFGKKIASTKEELDEFFKENYYEDVNDESFKNSYKYKKYQKALEAIENGLSIYSDWICFEECEYNYGAIFQDLWEELSKNSNNFKEIDTELDY